MLRWLVLVVFTSSMMLWRGCGPVYQPGTQDRLRSKLNKMAMELLKDAQMKTTGIRFYRDQYYKSFEYQIAEMVFQIREKFRKIVILYQLTTKNISQGRLYHGENLHTLTRIQQKGTEIDNLILMVEEMLIRKEKKTDIHKRMRAVIRQGDAWSDTRLRAEYVRASETRRPSDYYTRRPRNATSATSPRRRNHKWEYIPPNDQF